MDWASLGLQHLRRPGRACTQKAISGWTHAQRTARLAPSLHLELEHHLQLVFSDVLDQHLRVVGERCLPNGEDVVFLLT